MAALAFDQYETLQRDDGYLTELSSDIWLMDNHKWALWVWERFRQLSNIKRFSLIHADYHWDCVYDPHESPEIEEKLLAADLGQLKNLIVEDIWIRYDSFIVPAVKRGLFDEVHFFCKQDDGWDVGIDSDILAQCGVQQTLHAEPGGLTTRQYPSPIIFDLCLDLFNRSTMWNQGEIWPEQEILEFLATIRPLIEQALLVTVSLSFEYSGTEEDTRRLAKLVLPLIEGWRSAPFTSPGVHV